MKIEIFLAATASCTSTWPKPRPGGEVKLVEESSIWPKSRGHSKQLENSFIAPTTTTAPVDDLVGFNHLKVSGMWPKPKPSHSKLAQQATVQLRTVEPLTKPVNAPSLSKDWPKPKYNTVINQDQYINPSSSIPVEFESPNLNLQQRLKTEKLNAPIQATNEQEDVSSSGEDEEQEEKAELEGDLEFSRVIILQPLPDIDTVRIHFKSDFNQASGDSEEVFSEEEVDQRGPRPDDPVTTTEAEEEAVTDTTVQVAQTLPQHEAANSTAKERQLDYMTKIVYPALVVLFLALLMVLLTELYIRRQGRQSQRQFQKLNENELKRVEQENLLMKK